MIDIWDYNMYGYYSEPFYAWNDMYRWYPVYGFRSDGANAEVSNTAVAGIKGGPFAPQITGTVLFMDVPGGVQVFVEINGLPPYRSAAGGSPQVGPHGFHIHQNGTCDVGDPSSPFAAAGEHWNPTNQPHGNHAGDFPVLFSNNGYAAMAFFTDKFKVADVIGKSIIIHESPDDYRTQPAGASGRRLACGVITKA